jgi:transcriptional regulator with XRE-family HTH domain
MGKNAEDHEGSHPIQSALCQLRVEAGLTQSDLAAKAGCHQTDISRWEGAQSGAGNSRMPNIDTVRKLETAMGFPAGTILRMAGYVEEWTSAEQLIMGDPALDEIARMSVRATYAAGVSQTSARRTATIPTPPRRRGAGPRRG